MEPRTKKVLIGLSIGCGGLLVLFLATVVGFFVWVRQPGELLEPGRLIGDDTVGYAEWTLRLEDPGTEQFVNELLDEIERNQSEAMDRIGSGPLAMFGQWQRERDRRKFREIFPLVAAWTLTRGETPGRRHHLLSVSIEKMGNMMVLGDWILGLVVGGADRDLTKIRYQDEVLFHAPGDLEGLTFFLRGNDVFFTYDLDTARDAVDRLQPRAPEARPPTAVDQLFALLPPDRALRAVLTNESGEIYDMWSRLALPPDDPAELERTADELTALTLAGGLQGDQTFEGVLSLRCPDPAWAEGYRDEALRRFREGLAFERLELGADAVTEGEWIRIRFRIEGALEPLTRMLGNHVDGRVRLPGDVTQ